MAGAEPAARKYEPFWHGPLCAFLSASWTLVLGNTYLIIHHSPGASLKKWHPSHPHGTHQKAL